MAADKRPTQHASSGFSLMEVLAGLAVFGLLTSFGWKLISNSSKQRAMAQARAAGEQVSAIVLNRIDKDFRTGLPGGLQTSPCGIQGDRRCISIKQRHKNNKIYDYKIGIKCATVPSHWRKAWKSRRADRFCPSPCEENKRPMIVFIPANKAPLEFPGKVAGATKAFAANLCTGWQDNQKTMLHATVRVWYPIQQQIASLTKSRVVLSPGAPGAVKWLK